MAAQQEVLALTPESAEKAPPRNEVRPFDAIRAVAIQKLNLPPEWEFFSWEILDGVAGDLLVEGAVPHPGVRDSRKKWKGIESTQRLVITKAELDAASLAYEAESGKCFKCCGCGEEFAGWSHDTGFRYRTCSRCKGVGSSSSQPGEPAK